MYIHSLSPDGLADQAIARDSIIEDTTNDLYHRLVRDEQAVVVRTIAGRRTPVVTTVSADLAEDAADHIQPEQIAALLIAVAKHRIDRSNVALVTAAAEAIVAEIIAARAEYTADREMQVTA